MISCRSQNIILTLTRQMQPEPKRHHSGADSLCFMMLGNKVAFKVEYITSCACVFYLKDAGSLGHALQYGGFIAVLEEDGSVVVNILHLDIYSGCACPPTACWTVVYVQQQAHSQTYQLQ